MPLYAFGHMSTNALDGRAVLIAAPHLRKLYSLTLQIRTISSALSKCQLMVVFATATYGFKVWKKIGPPSWRHGALRLQASYILYPLSPHPQGTDAFATGEGEYVAPIPLATSMFALMRLHLLCPHWWHWLRLPLWRVRD